MRYVLKESIIGFLRNRVNVTAIVLTLWVSLTLFGLGLASTFQVDRLKGEWYDKIEVSVFMCVADTSGPNCTAGQDATDAQRAAVKDVLEHNPEVQHVTYETKAQAYANFKKAYAGSPVLDTINENMMQDSYRIKLKDPHQYQDVVAAVKNMPGVQAVQDLRTILEPLFATLLVAKWSAIVAAAMLLIAAVVQIATTIKITAVARNEELRIMRLVGASNATIMLPFIMECFFASMIGSGLAVITLFVGYKLAIVDQAQKVLAGTPWLSWSDMAEVGVACVACGVVLSVLPTIFSTRRVLKV